MAKLVFSGQSPFLAEPPGRLPLFSRLLAFTSVVPLPSLAGFCIFGGGRP